MALPLLAAVCLLPLLSHRSQSAVGRGFLPGTPTSGQDIRSTAPAVRSTWPFGVVDPRIPRGFVGWDPRDPFLLESAVVDRVTAALGRPLKFPRKVPRPIPGICRWWVWPSGGDYNFLKISFWRIIRLLMIFASIQKLWHQNEVSDKLDHTS